MSGAYDFQRDGFTIFRRGEGKAKGVTVLRPVSDYGGARRSS